MASAVKSYPKKLFYKINEVADIVEVEAYVLRYWETKFSMLKPERYGNDERRYRSKDIDLLLRIRHLLYGEKFTIAGAIERIKKDPTGALDAEFDGKVPEEASSDKVEVAKAEAASSEEEEEISQLNLFNSDAQEVNVEALKKARVSIGKLKEELQSILALQAD